MSVLTLLIILLIVGIVLPMVVNIDPTARKIINIVLVVLLIVWLIGLIPNTPLFVVGHR